MFITTIDDGPIIPKRLGLCSNFIGASEMCQNVIFDNDSEMEELPTKDNRRQFICGQCVSKLLSAKPVAEEPQKAKKGKAHGHGRTGARLPQGDDL